MITHTTMTGSRRRRSSGFYLAILVALMLTTYVPAISMTLPNLFE